MKRILAAVFCLFAILYVADATARFPRGTPAASSNPNLREQNVFGLKGAAWQDTANYYTPGTGSPAVSTADYFHGGTYWLRPYDLLNPDCGSAGSSIAAAKGRYVWFSNPDHADGINWADTNGIFMGFSNDPGVLPSRMMITFYRKQTNPSAKTADITASISGNNLIVSSVTGIGSIGYDNSSDLSGVGVTTARITGFVSGTQGGAGTYTINGAPQTVGPQAMVVSIPNYDIVGTPWFVCNPDDPSNTFHIYGEGGGASTGQQTGVIRSNDLVTWTNPQPAMTTNNFNGFAGYMRVVRNGVNDWYATGFTGGFPGATSFGYGYGKWTSTDGLRFAPPASVLMNACVPANTGGVTGNQPCTAATALFQNEAGTAPRSFTIAGQDWGITHSSSTVSSVRQGSQWVARAPIDSNFNVLQTPAIVNISSPYDGIYPGPGYVNAVAGYVEDGVAYYYANVGFPGNVSTGIVTNARYANGGACSAVPPANGTYGYFAGNGSISGTTLTVNSVATNSIVVGGQISGGNINPSTIVTGPGPVGSTGGAGNYTVSISQTAATTNFVGYSCGSLAQQAVDLYSEVIDATAAAGAAPAGVKASCAASTASLTWFNSLPTQTYRLYRGTSAGSQPTLVGDFTGTSATDTGMTLNAVTYYKLVYLNAGVEQKNRVVSTYCSSSIYPEVNAHITRALAEGADPTTCDRTFMDTFYGWLTTNGLKSSLLFATMPEFCVAKSGSVITKVFDMGTTRLPVGGDYTPTTSNTTYNATGINSKPAWVNGTSASYGYYGSGRYNTIQRKTRITLLAAYQKPSTGAFAPFALGQFNRRMMLSHTSGSPGAINCLLADATQLKTATAAIASATAVNTMGCTFDGTTLLGYANGSPDVSGQQTGLVIPSPTLSPTDMLTGEINPGNLFPSLVSGSDQGMYNYSGGFDMNGVQAQSSVRAQMVFDKDLSGAQVASWDALVR